MSADPKSVDKIYLRGIEFFAWGGVTDAERSIGQRYRADVEVFFDLSAVARSDALEDTVDLAALYTLVVRTARERPFKLLESVTVRIANRLLAQLPIDRARVRLEKLLPPIEGVVAAEGVEVTRTRT